MDGLLRREHGVNGSNGKWIYFMRQMMISSGVWTNFFMTGQLLGAPTVFVPQIRRENSTDPEILGDEMASWLYSVFGFAAVPWVFVLPFISRSYGLRVPYIIACIDVLLAYIIFYFSSTPLQILVSEIVFGICYAATLTIGILVVSEYSSPEYRGIFLTIKSASLFWGIWSSNAIGTFFHWKCIAYSGFLCSAYTFTFAFWPESPQWLASKGRFEECKDSFHWLHGDDDVAKKQVQELIDSQERARGNSRVNSTRISFSDAFRIIKCKQFYGPLLLSALLVTQYNLSGKFVCAIYAIDIIKKMTDSESAAYMGMLILDGVTVFGMYFGCYLSKILKRRTLYLTSSLIGIIFLFVISLYLFLVKLAVIDESKIVSIVMLMCFSLAMCCGPMIMNTSIYAEIIPIRFKNVIVLIAGLLFYINIASLLKISPYIFKSFGLHGSFLFYGITASVCLCLLYKYLPETKDKTLQEIEEYFRDSEPFAPEAERLK